MEFLMTFTRFEDIDAWKKGRLLVNEIQKITLNEPFVRDYDLKSQIRRAAISITSNIAEGFGRKGYKEFCNFLNYAHGSCAEVQSQLYHAHDWNYISEKEFLRLFELVDEISRMILGLENYLKKLS